VNLCVSSVALCGINKMNSNLTYNLTTTEPAILINRYLPFAILYFFFNILFLPFGLTWTAILGPLFYLRVLKNEKHDIFLPFIFIASPFLIAHMFSGVELRSYLFSFLNLLMIFFFAMAVKSFLKRAAEPGKIFSWILVLNFCFCALAIGIYFTPWRDLMWIRQNITTGVEDFLRLKMFTYEASYYAMLFVPVFIYFFLQYVFRQNRIPGALLLLMISLPLLLSFSIGVIASLTISALLVLLLNFRVLLAKRRVLNFLITFGVILFALAAVLGLFFPNNVFFERLANIITGQDTSAEGRTGDAFMLSVRILQENGSSWFGIGPGQLKFLGDDTIREYYMYYENTAVAIPNVAAETLLLFGWVGFTLRMFLLLFFFYITRVWTDYFRLSLFLFMFIYQFTGSYITNPAEWVIWVLAFTAFNRSGRGVLQREGTQID
jgi:hypothetical protein